MADKHVWQHTVSTCVTTPPPHHPHPDRTAAVTSQVLVLTQCHNNWLLKINPKKLKVSSLRPLLQPLSEVNIPPSRCLLHASDWDKTRPATPPYLHTASGSAHPCSKALANCQQCLTVRAKPKTSLYRGWGGVGGMFCKGHLGNMTLSTLTFIVSKACHVTSPPWAKNRKTLVKLVF